MSGVKRSEGATRRGSARERARSRFGSTTAEAYVSEFTDELFKRGSIYFLVAPSTTGSIYRKRKKRIIIRKIWSGLNLADVSATRICSILILIETKKFPPDSLTPSSL